MPVLGQAPLPTQLDGVETETSRTQVDTERVISALFSQYRNPNSRSSSPSLWATSSTPGPPSSSPRKPLPVLNRASHLNFLGRSLEGIPTGYVVLDASRPWLLYWILHGHDLLGAGLDNRMRRRAISTLLRFQNSTGGFGGGPGQISHLMPTYACVNALAIVGGPGGMPYTDDLEDDVIAGETDGRGGGGWDCIDRKAMYDFFMRLKQADGSFVVHEGGEVDVRGVYCVISVASLLGILTPELVRGTARFIASCQTYEGGLAAASHPLYHPSSLSPMGPPTMAFDPRRHTPPLGEAHGGYAFCALASWFALSTLPDVKPVAFPPSGPAAKEGGTESTSRRTTELDSAGESGKKQDGPQPRPILQSKLDLGSLLRWAVHLQGLAVEGGGFRGRTNKLVDGCYGWFVGGGMFGVLDAALKREEREREERRKEDKTANVEKQKGKERWTGPDAETTARSQTERSGQAEEKETEATPESKPEAEAKMKTEDEGANDAEGPEQATEKVALGGDEEEDWTSDDEEDMGLYDRIALQEYILVVAQSKGGGLRDKPGKSPDVYHTTYNLSGLSLSQHRMIHSPYRVKQLRERWVGEEEESDDEVMAVLGSEGGMTEEELKLWRRETYVQSLAWTEDPFAKKVLGSEENMVLPTHPVFNITLHRAKKMMEHFYLQPSRPESRNISVGLDGGGGAFLGEL